MAGRRFVADPPAMLRRVELDGLTALFHLPSGMTHIVAPPAPQILAALAGRPGDAAEILSRMAELYEVGGLQAELQPRLDELEAAGLIRVCAPEQAGPAEQCEAGPGLAAEAERRAA